MMNRKQTPRYVAAVLAALALAVGGVTAPSVANGQGGPGNGNGNPGGPGNGDGEPAPPSTRPLDMVVRIDPDMGYTPQDLAEDHPVRYLRTVLPSRGLHLFEPVDPVVARTRGQMLQLAKQMRRHRAVKLAEPNYETVLADDRYHSWPNGNPQDAGPDGAAFRGQPLAARLELDEAHRLSKGADTTVAVLDTGATGHPALVGRLLPGYDYVDDDADPTEVRQHRDGNGNGVVDEAYGHGTFVSGMVSLVAPEARILPMRVLDSDGAGSLVLVVQAIMEAVDLGANVINISLGTPERINSQMLREAIAYAVERDVSVVAAAGNMASDVPQYPAHSAGVLSVTSTDVGADRISEFANHGDWVDLGAPADRVLGPVPGGGYAWWAGSSMAAPQVSGQLALLRAIGERRAYRQIEAIERTIRKLNGRQVRHGRIDVLRSLMKAAGK